jgi:hypothetical protein
MDAGTTVIGHAVGDLDLEAMVPPGVTAGLADSPTCRKLGAGQVVEATINTSMFMSYQMLACIRGPHANQAVRDVMAMLNSLKFGRAPVS